MLRQLWLLLVVLLHSVLCIPMHDSSLCKSLIYRQHSWTCFIECMCPTVRTDKQLLIVATLPGHFAFLLSPTAANN